MDVDKMEKSDILSFDTIKKLFPVRTSICLSSKSEKIVN